MHNAKSVEREEQQEGMKANESKRNKKEKGWKNQLRIARAREQR